MSCEIENSIRKEKHTRKIYGPRYTYIFECKNENCSKEIRIRSDALKTASGYCKSHAQRKRPFESLYNGLKNDHRNTEINLTYEDYLLFTKESHCHYCYDEINWIPYGTESGKFISRSYYLDRKDNTKGYSLSNCVTCCTKCNRARSNKYTYDEWYGMTEYFRR